MANYELVVNSKFQPFSFERYIQPYQLYGQAYKELENQYGELATKSSIWEEMANEQTDPYAYKMYKNYANNLKEQADKLAKEGLNASSRRNMLNMRARYSKEITPIEQAYAARQRQAEQQQQALLQDPTLMLSRRAATTSLDDYIRNPQLAYEAYSGKLITAQAASAASALAKEMQTQPRKWRSILGNSYYETMMQKGFSSDAVLQAIQDNPNAAPQLTKIIEDAVNSSGVRNWGDQATIARAIDYAKQGLWSAVGETQYQTLDNWRAKMAAQEAMQIRAENRAAAREAEKQRQDKLKMYNINPSSLYGKEEVVARNKATKELLEKFKSKGYFNSQGALTKAGIKALQSATKRTTWKKGPGSEYYEVPVKTGDWEFKNWALEHGLTQTNIDAGNAGNASINRYYRTTLSRINSGELVTGTPNIDIYRQAVRDDATRSFLADKVTNTIGADGKIYRVGDLTVANGKVTMGKGNGLSQDEFKKLVKDSPILYVANSPVTNNQLIELTDGSKFIMPEGMLDNLNQENLKGANIKIMQSVSPQESAVNLNNANSYLGAILNYNEGTGISTNDGTIIVQ